MPQKVYHLHLKSTPERIFSWLSCEAAFPRLVPPHVRLGGFTFQGHAEAGRDLLFTLHEGIFSLPCRYLFTQVDAPVKLVRELDIGPLKSWRQSTTLTPEDDHTLVIDEVAYTPPSSAFDRSIYARRLESRIERFYHYRQQRLQNDLAIAEQYNAKPQRILITGASGLIGRDLAAFLAGAGHEVWHLTRNKTPAPHRIYWNPDNGELDRKQLEGFDAVFHLAGEGVANKRWSAKHKDYLLANRKACAELLVGNLLACRKKPKFLFMASAIGYYGHQPDTSCTETASHGDNFSSKVCQAIENAAKEAEIAGIRVVCGRIAPVLNPQGGSLSRLLLPFLLGLGGRLGSGKQAFSWIGLDDLIYALYHILNTSGLKGAVNLASPQTATNAEFTARLAQALRRPALLPLPAFVVRALFGQMGKELLLEGTPVVPAKLLESGFIFHFPTLLSALRWELGRTD